MRWKPEHVLAVMGIVATFGAAVGGAWVGGRISNNGARQLQADQARRDEQRQRQAAEAVGRVVLANLQRLQWNLWAAADDACWWPLDYRLKIAPNDENLLAAELPRPVWTNLAATLREMSYLRAAQRDGFQWRHGRPSDDMDTVIGLTDAIRQTSGGLADFAGVHLPQDPLRNGPQRVRDYRKAGRATYGRDRCNDTGPRR